jgi:phospholipid/cholesterol/gamma-HCH transport system substrate-binding protein
MKNTLETRLGIFFALALVVAVIILEMVGAAEYFKPGYQVTGSFKNSQELKRGDPVKIAGVEVGRVEDVQLVLDRAKVVMRINSKYDIKQDAKVTIKFTGLMGQNYVAITDGTSAAGIVSHKTGGDLDTTEQPDLSSIMVKLDNVASGVEGLTKSFSPENISTLLGPILNFVTAEQTNLHAIISNVRTVSEDVATGKGTVGLLIKDRALYDSAYTTMTNIQAVTAEVKTDVNNLMTQASGVVGQASGIMNQARTIVDDVQAGRGTIGKLVKDDSLYTNANNALADLSQVMAKINRGTGSVARIINDDMLYKNAKLSLQKLDKATEGLEDQGPLSVLGILVNNLF